jgi:hypothetical protein
MEPREFGCARCWGLEAGAAWEARGTFTEVAEIVDESHLGLRIVACPACGQRFASLFTELIDWQGGDDSQCWSMLPLAPEECERAIAGGEKFDLSLLVAWGRDRRHLVRVHPRGQDARVLWAEGGFTILPHD